MPTPALLKTGTAIKPYEAQNYEHLIGIKGFSEKLLKQHFKLYEGYVASTNTLNEKLRQLAADEKEASPEFSEMRRRFGWEFNGMRLHEYYFGNMGSTTPLAPDAPLSEAIASSFGDIDTWKRDFTATGAMRGIGWVICYQDPTNGRLLNVWIEEHNINHLAGGTPVLVMDVFEHAFITDYGLDRASYIKAFFENVNWETVASRLA